MIASGMSPNVHYCGLHSPQFAVDKKTRPGLLSPGRSNSKTILSTITHTLSHTLDKIGVIE